jgi:hypothetical protein
LSTWLTVSYQDLDIIVLNRYANVDKIQASLVSHKPESFYLGKPLKKGVKRYGSTFKKLYYRIPGTQRGIKVDLLVMSKPDVEIPRTLKQDHFEYLNSLDVAPDYYVLYHKLLGWDCRINSANKWKVQKATEVDYSDIIFLCDLLYESGVAPLDKSDLGRTYLRNFTERATKFCNMYGRSTTKRFKRIGFEV